MNVYVTIGGGTFFDSCMRVLKMDVVSGSVTTVYCADNLVYGESTKGFTGLSRAMGGYVATTEAEIFSFNDSFELINRVTFPFLNDVHHVTWSDHHNRYYVANTGLDTIEVFDKELFHVDVIGLVQPRDYFRAVKSTLSGLGRRLLREKECDLTSEDVRYKHLADNTSIPNVQKILWHMRFRRKPVDFRYVLLRPHLTHPNQVSEVGGELVATLKNPGEVRSLRSGSVLISGLKGPHDGFLKHGCFVLTESGSGFLLIARNISSAPGLSSARFRSVKVCNPSEGFLRGVDLIDEKFAVAAVSKRREITDAKPAWLAIVDLTQMRVVRRVDIPQEYGTNPFSVLN